MGDCLRAGKLSHYVTSHPGQLSLAIPSWVGAMSTGDGYDQENGEFCLAVALRPGLLVYWPSWLKALSVKLSWPSGRSGSYTGLIGFNPRRLKALKGGWAPTQRTYTVSMRNLLILYLLPSEFYNAELAQKSRMMALGECEKVWGFIKTVSTQYCHLTYRLTDSYGISVSRCGVLTRDKLFLDSCTYGLDCRVCMDKFTTGLTVA